MIVRVRDIVKYLNSLDQEAEVELDKDGWMEEDFEPTDVDHLVRTRGLFCYIKTDDGPVLVINN